MGQLRTAERITEAALRAFVVDGYAGASLEQVRRDAGVSNGSLYHHFPRRADLAARLLNDGMAGSRRGVLDALAASGSAQQGVHAVVRSHLDWVQEQPALARLLFSDLPDDVLLAAEPSFGEHNRRYVQTVGGWLTHHAELGSLGRRPFEVAHALWLGPAQEFARHWLRGRSRSAPTDVAADIAEGAWCALSVR